MLESLARGYQRRTDEGLSKDDIFHLLSSSHRRIALDYLENVPEGATLEELAEIVAQAEGKDMAEIPKVTVSLYQTHLPKLEEAGVIINNRHRDIVKLTDRADSLLDYLHYSPPTKKQLSFSRLVDRMRGPQLDL